MKHLRMHIIISVCIVLVVLVGAFVAFNELKYKEGTSVYLETQPVDPRDLFLGDYVILRYAIENENLPAEGILAEGQDAWVLVTNENPAQATAIVSADPGTTAIKGKISYISEDTARIDIPLDRYYIPVGSGRDMPAQPWTVHLRVSADGTARIAEMLKDGEPIELQARG